MIELDPMNSEISGISCQVSGESAAPEWVQAYRHRDAAVVVAGRADRNLYPETSRSFWDVRKIRTEFQKWLAVEVDGAKNQIPEISATRHYMTAGSYQKRRR